MDSSGKAIFWVCSGGQDSESGSFASLWGSVARRLSAADFGFLGGLGGPPSLPCVLDGHGWMEALLTAD